jgi:hypothetical protein
MSRPDHAIDSPEIFLLGWASLSLITHSRRNRFHALLKGRKSQLSLLFIHEDQKTVLWYKANLSMERSQGHQNDAENVPSQLFFIKDCQR